MTAEPLWRSLQRSLLAGEALALATLVNQRGSAPRPEGASLLVRADGSLLGAVSAGCLEADVVTQALRVLTTGIPELQRYQPAAADDPLSSGLSCGGSVDLVIERWSPEQLPQLEPLFSALANDEQVLLRTSLDKPGALTVHIASEDEGSPQGAGCPWPARAWIEADSNGNRVVCRLHNPAPQLWIFGATDIADALAALARPLGFRSTVIDARSRFATAERCTSADAVVCAWPHHWFAEQSVRNSTVICALNHDPKFEIPLLSQALRSPAAYIGAMGSRSTHRQRLQALLEAGLNEEQLQRLRAPIGLALGGRTAAEIALSILAEVVMLGCGGTGAALTDGQGRLHRR